jgi:hypothetical protein
MVAVKVMLSSESEAAQHKVRAEADILRGLRHPNVVLLMAICIAPTQQVRFLACMAVVSNCVGCLGLDLQCGT